jgi:Uma2 family endonuclease
MVSKLDLFPILRSEAAPPFERLSLEQYHQMIDTGILPEGAPIELIDGFLIRKDRSKKGESIMTVNKAHIFALDQFLYLLSLDRHQFLVRIQEPIAISPNHQPEPAIVIVRGTPRTYRDALPTASEILLLVEIADSSLSFDRTTKKTLYAAAGVPHYWIVNLMNRQIEIYGKSNQKTGTYEQTELARPGDQLALPAEILPVTTISVGDLF